jgi:peptidoglycan/LPS O-acetylase OafA/YrhL
MPFLRALIAGRPFPHVGAYLRNRLLRIVPAFWVVAAITALLARHPGSSVGQILGVFGYVQVLVPGPVDRWLGQAWTLSVELVFYLLLPLAAAGLGAVFARRCASPRARATALIGLLVAALLAGYSIRGLGGARWHFLAPANLYAFVPGILVAALQVQIEAGLLAVPARRVASALLAGAALALVLDVAFVSNPHVPSLIAPLGSGLLLGALVLRQLRSGDCPKVLDNAVMQWLGERSYGLYLVHYGIGVEVAEHLLGGGRAARGVEGVAIIFAVSVLAAAASYRVVELPFLRLRANWAPARARGTPSGAVTELQLPQWSTPEIAPAGDRPVGRADVQL